MESVYGTQFVTYTQTSRALAQPNKTTSNDRTIESVREWNTSFGLEHTLLAAGRTGELVTTLLALQRGQGRVEGRLRILGSTFLWLFRPRLHTSHGCPKFTKSFQSSFLAQNPMLVE